MDPRVSTIESDVAAMRAQVETIYTNYATNAAQIEAASRLDLAIVATKNELQMQIVGLDRKIDRVIAEQTLEFQKVAAEMRNWLMGTVIGLFIGFGGLVIGIAKIMRP